jgi:glutathione S-transferase
MELIIGTRKWSTWSLRAWLVAKRSGARFQETLIDLREVETSPEIRAQVPSGLVPALRDGDLLVWDSLAISEYLAERFPQARLWPQDPSARAQARSAAAEMHSGFAALRDHCPMDLSRPPERRELTPAVEADVRRIVELWRDLLDRSGGPWLFGAWSIADAFYTPVATRFRTYAVDLCGYGDDGMADGYARRLLDDADFKAWEAAS